MSSGLPAVMRDPDCGPYVTDEDDNALEDGVGWDLAFDCRVSFGVEPAGLVVTVSGAEGMTERVVTPDQVRDFARKLMGLALAVDAAS